MQIEDEGMDEHIQPSCQHAQLRYYDSKPATSRYMQKNKASSGVLTREIQCWSPGLPYERPQLCSEVALVLH